MWGRFAGVALIGLAGPGAAADYLCRITPEGRTSKVFSEQVLIRTDIGRKGRMMVIDRMIQKTFDGPTEGRVRADTASKAVFSWDLPVRGRGGVKAAMAISLEFDKVSGKARIAATFRDFSNTYSASGVCFSGN